MIPEHLLCANVVCMGMDNVSLVSHFFLLTRKAPKKMPPVRGGGVVMRGWVRGGGGRVSGQGW